ncbi:MAG: hypothetical protein ACI8X3_001922, partial [Saprospiraceae bacterium]
MKKQSIKNIQTVQQFQNVNPLTKTELRQLKGGDDIVIED